MDKLVFEVLAGLPAFVDKVFFTAQLTEEDKDIELPSIVLRKVGSDSESFLDEGTRAISSTYNVIVYERDPAALGDHESDILDALNGSFTVLDYRHVEDVLSEEDGDIYVRLITATLRE